MERTLTPELLDQLPMWDKRARRSRRDLRRLNRLMGNPSWWARVLEPELHPGERILEIGAGDGATRLLRNRRVDGLDRCPRPAAWPPSASWHRSPIERFERWNDYQAVIGNLVFHHLAPSALRSLGARLEPGVRVVAACEPVRARRFVAAIYLLAPLLRLHAVTRHDARASIAAGFRADELPGVLGLDPARWQWTVTETWRGAHRMVAIRRR